LFSFGKKASRIAAVLHSASLVIAVAFVLQLAAAAGELQNIQKGRELYAPAGAFRLSADKGGACGRT